MEGRAYAVVEERGVTRFVLPRRARTFWQKAGGGAMMALGACFLLGLAFLVWEWLRIGGGLPWFHGAPWIALLLAVICPVPFKYGWEMLRGGQGEVRVSVLGNFLRATNGPGLRSERIGWGVEWEQCLLTDVETLEIEDAREPFMPKENAYLWARRLKGARVCLLRDYPRWLLEELAGDLEEPIREAKAQAEAEEER